MSDLPCDSEPTSTGPDRAARLGTAEGLLHRAASLMQERAQTYDRPEGERSMATVVEAFGSATGQHLRESEGWLFMLLLKAVRSETRSQPHQDSIEDLIAYAALYGEARGAGR